MYTWTDARARERARVLDAVLSRVPDARREHWRAVLANLANLDTLARRAAETRGKLRASILHRLCAESGATIHEHETLTRSTP